MDLLFDLSYIFLGKMEDGLTGRTDEDKLNVHVCIGGSLSGSAVAVGHHNRQHVGEAAGDDGRTIISCLEKIHIAIAQMTGPQPAAAQAGVSLAIDEAKKEKPDHRVVGAAVDMALGALHKMSDFADSSGKLVPLFHQIGAALGAIGVHLTLPV